MDVNWGIAIAAVCGTIIVAILRFKNNGRKSNPGNPVKMVSEDHCRATHKAIDENMRKIHENVKNIFGKIDEQNKTLARIEGKLNIK